jgi:hypothetical protein
LPGAGQSHAANVVQAEKLVAQQRLDTCNCLPKRSELRNNAAEATCVNKKTKARLNGEPWCNTLKLSQNRY